MSGCHIYDMGRILQHHRAEAWHGRNPHAPHLYKKAAEKGSLEAQLALGDCYNGDGVAKDYEEAMKWYLKAAAQGNPMAQKNVGILRRYFRKAAAQGNASAQKKSSGCFITTAVCQCFGKSDDCYELTMFRRFRDDWLMKQPDGKALIAEYYATAPPL